MSFHKIIYNYAYWFILISLLCCAFERIKPWRNQLLFRNQIIQDIFWMIFNIFLFGYLFSPTIEEVESFLKIENSFLNGPINIDDISLPWQIVIGLTLKDFCEWIIHNLLHRVPLFWRIHQLHHSIKIMDWLGNTRFHFLEIFVYKIFKYLPLMLIKIPFQAILIIDIFSTLIGHLNHSNLNLSYGPLKYVFNSPAMHIWHHDKTNHFKNGQNFGIVFSFWDYIFGTAYVPAGQPKELGFNGDEKYQEDVFHRLLWPFVRTNS